VQRPTFSSLKRSSLASEQRAKGQAEPVLLVSDQGEDNEWDQQDGGSHEAPRQIDSLPIDLEHLPKLADGPARLTGRNRAVPCPGAQYLAIST
jgi:hypothetical protein